MRSHGRRGAWGAAKTVGAAWGAVDVIKVGNKEAMKGQAV
jgi:hypothetical protein